MTFRYYFVSGHVNCLSPLKVEEGHFHDSGGTCATSCVAGRIEKAGASRSHYTTTRGSNLRMKPNPALEYRASLERARVFRDFRTAFPLDFKDYEPAAYFVFSHHMKSETSSIKMCSFHCSTHPVFGHLTHFKGLCIIEVYHRICFITPFPFWQR